jgi:hypothetical protein
VAELERELAERKEYIVARGEQIKVLECEVADVRARIFDAKLDLAKLGEENVEVMKKFFAAKDKERRSLRSPGADVSGWGKVVTSIPRFAGGGFCLSRPQ